MSIAAGGGSPQVVVNVGQTTPVSVATDGTAVYFLGVSASTSLLTAPVAGGSAATLTSADLSAANIANDPGPTVAVDSQNVYWLNPPQIVKMAK
jgi:hypothetical protein